MPIFGDDRYGWVQDKHSPLLMSQELTFSKKKALDLTRTIFLHAGELSVPLEPGSKERKKFVAKLKKPMERVLDHLHIPN